MSLLVQGGRIVDPSLGLDVVGDVLVEDGLVRRLGGEIAPPAGAEVIRATGLVVCPGFIDLHCHLREPGFEEKETIATGTAAAARGGFTTVCAMPNTTPPTDDVAAVEFLLRRAREVGRVKVLPIACVTVGREGRSLVDMAALAKAGVVGFSDDGSPVADDGLMRSALLESASLGLPIINHCEVPALSLGGVMNQGPVATVLGLPGVPSAAEEDMVARDIVLAEATGGWLHVAHLSTAGSVALVREARERGVRVTAEATPHHLTITEDWAVVQGVHGDSPVYNTHAKVNPPLRSGSDVEAVVLGLRDGVIDCVATDHAPHTREDKECSFQDAAFGISGLETALGSLMSLVQGGRMDLSTLVERLTTGPARILGRPESSPGTLKPGSPADVVIFDPLAEWTVNPADFASKGRNTPLAGTTLRGRVVATIVDGVVVYQDEAVSVG